MYIEILLKEAKKENLDFYKLYASRKFGLPYEEVTPILRRKAKESLHHYFYSN